MSNEGYLHIVIVSVNVSVYVSVSVYSYGVAMAWLWRGYGVAMAWLCGERKKKTAREPPMKVGKCLWTTFATQACKCSRLRE